ncbi:MAG: hypothetical protein KAH03_02990 [Cocleimonas sp.]|nr:hypothetical protein [Cocleimonas sp.]
MLKFIKSSLLLLFIFNVTACSYSPTALKITYSSFAEEVAEELKEPIDLSSSQSTMIDDYANELLQWHRQNKLPEYAKSFAQFAMIVQQDTISLPQLKTILKQLDGMPHFDQANHLTEKMLIVAKTLTTEQIKQLEQSLNNSHQQDVLATNNKNFTTEVTSNVKGMFRFIGIQLNDSQLAMVKKEAKNIHNTHPYQIQATKQWNQQFVNLLKQPHRPDFDTHFKRLWATKDHNLKGKGDQLEQQNTAIMAVLIRKLIMRFEDNQRNHLSKQLSSISTTFNEMAYE